MTLQTAFTEDDIGAILRIHLMTEKLVESWICAACNQANFFGIPNNKIDSLKDTLNGYRLNEYNDDKHSDEMPIELYNSDGSIKGTYSMNSSETPNRLKLFLLFMMFQTKLILTVSRIHLAQGANPANNSPV